MAIQCVGIHWNSTKETGIDVARRLAEAFRVRSVEVCVNHSLYRALNMPELLMDAFERCQLLIVLGGDGTILTALDRAIPYDLPILGVNLGRLGFLTAIEVSEIDRAMIDRIIAEDYAIDARMTMRIEGQDDMRVFALNDVVITRATPSVRIISVEYRADGELVDCVSGDGLIVATATGSTAYSLSSGGPIIMPGLECFVLTPVCPHTLNARPVVISSDHRITIRVLDDRGGAQAVLDGRTVLPLNNPSRSITICRSDRQARFVRLKERNVFNLLHSKLSEWTH